MQIISAGRGRKQVVRRAASRPVQILDSGQQFWTGSDGTWAGGKLAAAIKAGRPMSPAELRTNEVLQRDEWVFFDDQLIQEAAIRLVGVADLREANLIRRVPNAMGKTVYEYEKMTDMNPATVSLDGLTNMENDRADFQLAGLPLPITHKDFIINLRQLEASRTRGEGLDATQVRMAGRLVSEKQEDMLFNGGKTFGGLTIYGYRTHPDRNILSFGTNGAWSATAKTGENILADLLNMVSTAEARGFRGPYWLYLPRNSSTKLDNDFKSNGTQSIRQRLLSVAGIDAIRTADQLPADNILLVQHTMDVVAWVEGEPLQSIQWDIHGGFGIYYKAFSIGVPLIRSNASGGSGIVHMS